MIKAVLLVLLVSFACKSSEAPKTQASSQPAETAEPGTCSGDTDCAMFSSYCDGCKCIAIRTQEADPVCTGKNVNCLVDPCADKAVECRAGKCVLTP